MHLATETGVAQQLLHIEQPAGAAVDRVLAAAVAEQRAGDRHLGVLDRQSAVGVVDGEGDLGAAEGTAGRGAREDDVLHLAAAEGLGALLPHHPGERVDDVALARAVGADDAGDAGLEGERGRLSEGLEPLEGQALQIHPRPPRSRSKTLPTVLDGVAPAREAGAAGSPRPATVHTGEVTRTAVRALAIPERPGADGWKDFVALTAIGNAIEAEGTGTDDLGYSPETNLGEWRQQEFSPRRAYLAERDGRVVGGGELHWSAEPGDDAAWLSIAVLPDERGQGAGTALLERLSADAVDLGRRVLQTWTAHRADAGGERTEPLSGAGSVPSADTGSRWLAERGWSLEQVERVSVARLPIASLEERRRVALEHSAGYEVLHWRGATPEEWIDDLLLLRTAMSTQAPSAGLSVPEETWTRDRLAAHERGAAAGGRVELASAALHRSSGRLVGYCTTDLLPDRPALWGDTLVLPEHRGHRLGMLLKLDALEQLAATGCSAVYTWNAEENRPMLTVNEAVGFTAVAVEGQWKKVLA
ncbi:GNAT family N-acetyltransferase [Rathayibacter sp. VKM Ac-2754]|nr:GNAT family N-acetyltransferase [Rathayibacter sp. VKM Ac-2754]